MGESGMRIGVIGIRSKHLYFFRESLLRLFPEGKHRITHICGLDAPDLLDNWPDMICCDTPKILIDSVDAVIIALREGYQHAALAQLCMEAGKPVFVDKPFTCDPAQAQALAQLSAKSGILCTGGSTVCFTKEVRQLKNKLPQQNTYEISYMADPFTPFGGWYFYGSHLTDVCVTLFGTGWTEVRANQQGCSITAWVKYPDCEVVLRSSPNTQPFLVHAGELHRLDDHGCYDAGMAHFIAAAEGKESGNAEDLVSSVKLLKGILTSLKEGQPFPG